MYQVISASCKVTEIKDLMLFSDLEDDYMPKCKICGKEYPPEEMVGDICINCASAMMQKDGIDFGLGMEDT